MVVSGKELRILSSSSDVRGNSVLGRSVNTLCIYSKLFPTGYTSAKVSSMLRSDTFSSPRGDHVGSREGNDEGRGLGGKKAWSPKAESFRDPACCAQ
jgi:hypothetical protein